MKNLLKRILNKGKSNFDNFPPIGGLMVSKMVVDEKIKPNFMYREKRIRPEDSGWRIFTGFETAEYTDNPDNAGIYNASTILEIDPSIHDILLKGVGSVYERNHDTSEWYKVTDFDLEDDYMTTHGLTENWTIEINNLFERSVEEDGTLYYTTDDKSIRIMVWNSTKNKQELYEEYCKDIDNRDQSKAKTSDRFEFSDDIICRIGYLIKEKNDKKEYSVLLGFSIVDKMIVQMAIYFDEQNDLDWAIDTWKNIKYKI